jgi:alanyl-tRNA synthetase
LMHRLVPALIAEMGAAYPELLRAQASIESTLLQEETQFRRTLTNGLRLLDEATARMSAGDTLPGETAFKLYDTFGFPYDLTEDALRGLDMHIDRAGFDAAMAEQKRAARAAWKGSGAKASDDIWFDIAEQSGGTEFLGYTATAGEGQVVALVKEGARVDQATTGDTVSIIVNQTPFYGESGGQVGDTGTIANDEGLRAQVTETSKQLGRIFVHHAIVDAGGIKVGDTVKLQIDVARRDQIRANHSATHLLHEALRQRLGLHVAQKGSLVAPDRLRFDFSQPAAIDPARIGAVEADVNHHIRGNSPVSTRLMTPAEAIEEGAMALFGEKYGDEVRVVSMGREGDKTYSLELCGGTHVTALGDIGLFKVVGESAVSSGVRRIEALTGEAARQYLASRDEKLREAAATLKATPDEVPARVAALVEDRRRLERELAEAKKALAMGGGGSAPAGPEQIGEVQFVGQVLQDFDPKGLRGAVDEAKQRIGSGVVVMLAVNEGRASIAVGVSADLVGSHNAVDLLRSAVAVLGGQGGGGRPDMAQGGGPDADKAADAIAAVRSALAG